MNPTQKYFLYGLILLALVVAALAGSQRLVTNLKISPTKEANPDLSPTVQNADYIAATTSFGPIIQTQEISVEFDDENDRAYGFVTTEEVKAIEARQHVILYDEEGNTLPLGGRVETLEKTDENTVKVTISLPEETNTEYLLKKPEIMTLETTGSKRLPLRALQKDKTGGEYIWTTHPQESQETYKTTRRYIEKGLTGKNYFTVGHEIGTYDLVILNPDKKIRSDKTYNISITEFYAPLHNPIRQAWIDYDLHRLEKQQEELIQAAEDCRNNKGSDTSDTSSCGVNTPGSSCGGSATSSCGTADPLAIFNSLLENNPGSAGGCSSSCGSEFSTP